MMTKHNDEPVNNDTLRGMVADPEDDYIYSMAKELLWRRPSMESMSKQIHQMHVEEHAKLVESLSEKQPRIQKQMDGFLKRKFTVHDGLVDDDVAASYSESAGAFRVGAFSDEISAEVDKITKLSMRGIMEERERIALYGPDELVISHGPGTKYVVCTRCETKVGHAGRFDAEVICYGCLRESDRRPERVAELMKEKKMDEEETEGLRLFQRVVEATADVDANVRYRDEARGKLSTAQHDVETSNRVRRDAMKELREWIEEQHEGYTKEDR